MEINPVYDLTLNDPLLSDHNNPTSLELAMVGTDKDVLELGCATGYMTRMLSQHRRCRVTGVELVAEAADQARPYCRRLIVGDIEAEDVLAQARGAYDVILAGDVLEHVRYPDRVLAALRSTLRLGGYWVISVPNIAHWSVRKELLLGRFNFTSRGIMDASHLRWFTIKTLKEMLGQTGYRVQRLETIYTLPFQDALKLRSLASRLQRTKLAQGFFGYHIIVTAAPA